MSRISPRIDAVIAAFLGKPSPVFTSAIDDDLQRALSPGQQDRLNAALTEQICIYPEREGWYRVISPASEQSDATSYAVDLKYAEAKTCTCGDFMFRLDARRGQMCKHMWRAYILVTVGCLPAPDANPYDWLLDELTTDLQLVQALADDATISSQTAVVEQMQELLVTTKNTHRIAVEYPSICTQRARILQSI